MPNANTNTEQLDPAILERINRWKDKLINLTRQNNLVYYKQRKVSTLVVKEPSPNELFGRLLDETLTIWDHTDKEQKIILNERKRLELAPDDPDPVIDWMKVTPPKKKDIITQFDFNRDLYKKLKSLYRRSNTEYQEKGINILYAVFGFLEWKEKPEYEGRNNPNALDEKIRSPLVMVPIKMSRKSAKDPFQIETGDDDIVVNPALRVKIKRDFNVDLPDDPDDWDADALENYFALAQGVFGKLNFKIIPECHLGLFSFHKLVMYNDINRNAGPMANHPVIKTIAAGNGGESLGKNEYTGVKELDGLSNPDRLFQVLDADSSQQQCIESAIAGNSFVMVGPPGTGKSQTITNIIAEFLEDGKSVLFVSEKMAALEVVYKRLKDVGLEDFCLELHSHKKNKKEVITELARCLYEHTVPHKTISKVELNQLLDARNQLNEYVIALHQDREPVGMPVFKLHGLLAQLNEVPYIPCSLENLNKLTPSNISALKDLVIRAKDFWEVYKNGNKHPWCGFKATKYTPELSFEIDEFISKATDDLTEALDLVNKASESIGYSTSTNPNDLKLLNGILQLLSKNGYCLKQWLQSGTDIEELIHIAETEETKQSQYKRNLAKLQDKFNDSVIEITPHEESLLKKSLDEFLKYLKVSESGQSKLFGCLDDLQAFVDKWEDLSHELHNAVKSIGAVLNLGKKNDYRIAKILRDAFSSLIQEPTPLNDWINPSNLKEVQDKAAILASNVKELKSLRDEKIKTKYTDGIYQLDLERLLQLYDEKGKYRKITRFLRPQYHRDKKLIKDHCLSQKLDKPHEIHLDLCAVQKISQLNKFIEDSGEGHNRIFGKYYNGEESDFDTLTEALKNAERTITHLTKLGIDAETMAEISALLSETLPDAKRLISLVGKYKEWYAETQSFEQVIPWSNLPENGTPLIDLDMNSQSNLAGYLSATLKKIIKPTNAIFEHCKIAKAEFTDFNEVLDVLKTVPVILEYKNHCINNAELYEKRFGSMYGKEETNWETIRGLLKWTWSMLQTVPINQCSDKFIELICNHNRTWKGGDISKVISTAENVAQKLDGYFDNLYFEGRLIRPAESEVEIIKNKILELASGKQQLREWVDANQSYSDCKEQGLTKFIDRALESGVDPSQLDNVFDKSVYQGWLNGIYEGDKRLYGFRSINHERIRNRFRELDKKLNFLSRALVIQSANDRKPDVSIHDIGGGQVEKLRREHAKQKRHMPLRKLFKTCPELIKSLKHCFLMSPLSVSQLIDHNLYQFDLVIFDEASQICTEDAISPILRGKQVVVSGDSKQLPPTSFFASSGDVQHEYDEGDEEQIEDLSSVLDEFTASGIKEMMLRWHYRSKHEDLISFSNDRFYENKLVTFPSPNKEHEKFGVKFQFVTDAIYDRGGKRNNWKEAERVADLVIEHYQKYPNKTLGVVALSMQQRDAVSDVLDKKRVEHPHIEKFFSEDRLEGMFVKNLENVQGDERDVIILSVGYGRDNNGAMSMNFGPINKEGGWRRLNVVVTRAREKMIVVASIKASDFDMTRTDKAGVVNLMRYLKYAEHGYDALSFNPFGYDGEYESPFEESVANTIKNLGYDPIPQVGCSGYKIDLGILDPSDSGRFLIGVECDGATYHSSYTARDRDRIREDVLRNLGWKLHRIWSADWVNDRENEFARLKAAIEKAKYKADFYEDENLKKNSETTHETFARTIPAEVKDNGIAHTYEVMFLNTSTVALDSFLHRNDHYISEKMRKVIDTEAPVHLDILFQRVADSYQFSRVGHRIYQRLMMLLGELCKEGYMRKNSFVYKTTDIRKISVRKPDPDEKRSFRSIDHIAPGEMQSCIYSVVKLCLGIDKDMVCSEVSKILGFNRMGDNIFAKLKKHLKSMIDTGMLFDRDGHIVVNEEYGQE